MNPRHNEAISFYSHLGGAIAAAAGTILLVWTAPGPPEYLAVTLAYGLSAVFLFTASALYHAFKKGEDEISLWRKLDHIAIFFMIAGTYTPLCYIYLAGYWRWTIIGVQWTITLFGLFFKIFFLRAPRLLYTLMYVAMGWVAIIPIKQFIDAMDPGILLLVFSGGIAYTAGAVFYAVRRPVIVAGMLGYHEIFHVFILLGGTLHYVAIYNAVSSAVAA